MNGNHERSSRGKRSKNKRKGTTQKNSTRSSKLRQPANSANARRSSQNAEESTSIKESHFARADRKPVTVVCGDSIVQNVRGWKLSRSNKVVVKSFSGATTSDMEDYLKPITRKCPESLILHVGTNDLLSIQTPQQIAESIVNLADQIESDSPETLVSISAICVRKEDELWKKATEINKLLKSACEVQCESRIDDFISPILPSSRGFKLANLNVASLVKHIDELRILLTDTPVDVLSINETRLDDSVKDSDVYIPGYEIIRRDRKTNGRFGGGVCFFVRSNISYSLRSDLSIHQLENLCIEIRKPRSKPFLVVTWYRPPDSSVEIFSYFESLMGKIDAENVEFYVLGDLNCNLAAPQLDHNANLLSSIADVYSLQQLITDPTRCTESSSTLTDLVFTNRPDRIVCSGVSHVGISDHSLIYAYRKLSIDLPSRGHTTRYCTSKLADHR
ncbi:uncharacterized protein [Montipora capricornis]|uniref:uncharacterized protein n=1 Tax=Montipora capricornis TaxID=246305 RepID=UPI0035F18E3C